MSRSLTDLAQDDATVISRICGTRPLAGLRLIWSADKVADEPAEADRLQARRDAK